MWPLLAILPACDPSCEYTGGTMYTARLVVGVGAQTVARDDLTTNATALVLRGQNEATFPLVPLSSDAATRIAVQSDFRLVDVAQSSSLYDGEARIGRMGVYIPLATDDRAESFDSESGLFLYDGEGEFPFTDSWRGSFEVELQRAEGPSTRVTVDVAPFLSPCGDDFAAPMPPEYAPNARIDVAADSTATCLDGSECIARGTLLDRDAHSIGIGPFVISTRVQAWCEPYYGY